MLNIFIKTNFYIKFSLTIKNVFRVIKFTSRKIIYSHYIFYFYISIFIISPTFAKATFRTILNNFSPSITIHSTTFSDFFSAKFLIRATNASRKWILILLVWGELLDHFSIFWTLLAPGVFNSLSFS